MLRVGVYPARSRNKHTMIVSDPNPEVNLETATLFNLAGLLRDFAASPHRPVHERVLFTASAVLLDRAARLRDADVDVNLAAQVEDALHTAARVAVALGESLEAGQE